jgi:phage terminase large subunit-like protein
MVMITTAGYDRSSICWEQHAYGRGAEEGRIDDPGFYTRISAAEETDDWTDPGVWQKANPNLGVTVKRHLTWGQPRLALDGGQCDGGAGCGGQCEAEQGQESRED